LEEETTSYNDMQHQQQEVIAISYLVWCFFYTIHLLIFIFYY
jgi:hypothetical protein